MALYHDEEAYRLQAEIFATGRWAAPSPPLPEFFHQYHILVEPAVASKYFPGHSLVLAPGTWLGLPGLVPLLLSALAGVLIFTLARRVAGPWVAALTWLIWLGALDNLWWRASYLSETSSSLLWLLGCWFLLRYRERGRAADMLWLAAAAGWTALTRPLTAAALFLPIGIVVLTEMRRRRRLWHLVAGLAMGMLILGVIPLWSWKTLGTLDTTPWGEYTRQYLPWDGLGFGREAGSPSQQLPADLERFSESFAGLRAEHTVSALPRTIGERVASILSGAASGWRAILIPLGLWSLLVGGIRHRAFVCGSWLALFLAYLLYAHPPRWTLYQLETFPVLALFMAVGLWRLAVVGATRLTRATSRRGPARLAAVAVLLAMGCGLPGDLRLAREQQIAERQPLEMFRRQVETATSGTSGVFVRYAPDHATRYNFVRISANVRGAKTVLARDRGGENIRLMRSLPGRAWYRFDEVTGMLRRLDADESAAP